MFLREQQLGMCAHTFLLLTQNNNLIRHNGSQGGGSVRRETGRLVCRVPSAIACPFLVLWADGTPCGGQTVLLLEACWLEILSLAAANP